MLEYACKLTSSGCLSRSFTAVREDIPKCMPEESLRKDLSLSSSQFRGFESHRASYDVSPAVWKICPSGRKKNGTRNRVRERFYSDIRYHSAKRECFGTSRRAMQKQALPENGYRVIPNSAKRFLSALCRRHSNFQPLLLHE